MRPTRDALPGPSHTPIYDALYSEYHRAFRALPGDRSGEEDLGFTAFGVGMHSSQGVHSGSWRSGSWHSGQGGNSSGRQHHTGNHFPAALPPAPRRGL